MVRQFKTASTRLEMENFEKFNRYCADQGITPFTELKKHILEKINDESRTELGKNGELDREKPQKILGKTNSEPNRNENWFW